MPERVQKPRTIVKRNTRTEAIDVETTKQERRRLQDELNDLLDEIDATLADAEELDALMHYRQRGGE